MPVMRGVYFIVESERRIKGWHSHAADGRNPLCKLDKRQVSNQQKFIKWEYEDSEFYTCPACKKIARDAQEQRILEMFGRGA